MLKSLVIEPMTIDDLDQVVGIENDTPSPWSREQIVSELGQPSGWQFVVRQLSGSEVVGYIFGRQTTDEAEILKIAVAEKNRRRGVACLLLKQALQHMRKFAVENCYLELRESNKSARNLYEKHGFIVTGGREKYYKAPLENAALMMKKIEKR